MLIYANLSEESGGWMMGGFFISNGGREPVCG